MTSVSYGDTNQDEQQEAIDNVQRAIYKQLGIEEYINTYAESLVPPEYRRYLQHVAPIAETIKRQRLELKWDF